MRLAVEREMRASSPKVSASMASMSRSDRPCTQQLMTSVSMALVRATPAPKSWSRAPSGRPAAWAAFAAHGSVALRAAQTKEDLGRLREVVEARELIGQAKGILMGRQGISSQAAMDILCRGAERLKIELYELVRRVVEGEEDKSQKA
jgi:hypothetical protein